MDGDGGVARTDEPGVDFRGSRRLVGREEWWWYLVAAVSYIGLGIYHKFLLNWFVGPIWLVAVVTVGPAVWDRIRGRRADPDVEPSVRR